MNQEAGARPRPLPTTTYAVLGMLTFGECSGYDLGKAVDESIGYFWSPAKSHIYAELRRLVTLGYASERKVEQEDRPDKRLYRITAAGERALREWLNDPEVMPESVKSPFLLKLFFGHLMEPERLAAQVQEVKRQVHEMLARLAEIEKRIRDRDDLFFPYMTLRSGVAHCRATSRWADDVLKRLEERSGR